jgi:threonine/homoserine/homoserine lactone efflux protein
MFTKYDEEFSETAADPMRRLAAITDLTNRRTILFWCACVISLVTIASSFGSKPAGGALALCAAIQWMLVFKFESDLRLLRVIDRLQR